MKPPPPPLTLTNGRGSIICNEPMEQGCVTVCVDGVGISVFVKPEDLMRLSAWALAAHRRIEANARAATG
jgi:hypothetical protein